MIHLLVPFQQPLMFLLVALGVFSGIYIGAIPGLSATMAVSLLLSVTYGWETNLALALMIGIFCGTVYGGSRSAILLNIPGAPAAIATGFDGYPLARQGRAGEAIALTTIQSFLGGLIGIVGFAFFTPLLSRLALQFSAMDYVLLSLMGILASASLGTSSPIKGLSMACLGLLIGTIGLDPFTARPRFVLGWRLLLAGIEPVSVMIGLFGLAEALYQLREVHQKPEKQEMGRILPDWKIIKKFRGLTLRSSLIGLFVGALPGTGGDLAALMAYHDAKRTKKDSEVDFGKGNLRGIVAPETANNAAIGGAFIPMLTLGIPGDAVTAVLLGALSIHGIRTGPMLMKDTPHLFFIILSCLMIANLMVLIFGLGGIRFFVKAATMNKARMLPMIMVLSVIGAYSLNHRISDVLWMVTFGFVGYMLKRYHYPVSPMVLGLILSNFMEMNLRRALLSARGFGPMLIELLQRPLTLLLLGMVILPLLLRRFQARR